MFRLASMLYSIIATSLAGAGVITVLTMGYDSLTPILLAAGCGALLALPVAFLVARALTRQ